MSLKGNPKETLPLAQTKPNKSRAWMFYESPATTADMAVLPGVLGCRTLRRTAQVRLRSNTLRVARWHAHLHGLATAINETSRLEHFEGRIASFLSW